MNTKSSKTGLKGMLKYQRELNQLHKSLLGFDDFNKKLKKITDVVVKTFSADLCGIWLTNPCDSSDCECDYTKNIETDVCSMDKCLHFASSSGYPIYTKIHHSRHRRVPMGCDEIGMLAVGEKHKVLLNLPPQKLNIYNQINQENLTPISFAGYQIRPQNEDIMGVLIFLSKHYVSPQHDIMLESIANTTGHVIKSARTKEGLVAEQRQRVYDTLYDLPVIFYLIDQNFSIKFCNKNFQNIYGVGEGRICYSLLANRSKPCTGCTASQVFKTGNAGVPSCVSLAGREYLIHSGPFEEEDDIMLVSMIHVDVTNRLQSYSYKKQLEACLLKYSITPRERSILEYILRGKSDKEIGDLLFISPNTVKRHTQSIYQKINVHSRISLMSLFKW